MPPFRDPSPVLSHGIPASERPIDGLFESKG